MTSDELLKFLVEGNYVGKKFSLISFFSRFPRTELSLFTIGMGSGLERSTVIHLLEELVKECTLFKLNTGAIATYVVSPKYRPLMEELNKLHPIEKQKLERQVKEALTSTWG